MVYAEKKKVGFYLSRVLLCEIEIFWAKSRHGYKIYRSCYLLVFDQILRSLVDDDVDSDIQTGITLYHSDLFRFPEGTGTSCMTRRISTRNEFTVWKKSSSRPVLDVTRESCNFYQAPFLAYYVTNS